MTRKLANAPLPFELSLGAAEALYREAAPSGWDGVPCAAFVGSDGRVATTTDMARAPGLAAATSSIAAFFADDWREGDVAISNDPFHGSTHLLEVTAVAPVWTTATPPATPDGFAILQAGIPDLGGWDLGGDDPRALDIWAEGARIVPVKLERDGKARREVLDILALNSRTPHAVQQCARAMARAVGGLVRDAGAEGTSIDAAGDTTREAGAAAVGVALARIASGSYSGAASVPIPGFDDANVAVAAELSVLEGRLRVTFSEAPERTEQPINATPAMTRAAVLRAVAAGLELDARATLALDDVIDIDVPFDSVLAVTDWAPVGYARLVTCRAVFAAIAHALESAGGAKLDIDTLWRLGNGLSNADFDSTSGGVSSERRTHLLHVEANAAEV